MTNNPGQIIPRADGEGAPLSPGLHIYSVCEHRQTLGHVLQMKATKKMAKVHTAQRGFEPKSPRMTAFPFLLGSLYLLRCVMHCSGHLPIGALLWCQPQSPSCCHVKSSSYVSSCLLASDVWHRGIKLHVGSQDPPWLPA